MLLTTMLTLSMVALAPDMPNVESKGRAVRSAPRKASKAKPKKKVLAQKEPAKQQAGNKTTDKNSTTGKTEATPSRGPGLMGTMAAAAAGSYVGNAIANHFDSEEEVTEELEVTDKNEKTESPA